MKDDLVVVNFIRIIRSETLNFNFIVIMYTITDKEPS